MAREEGGNTNYHRDRAPTSPIFADQEASYDDACGPDEAEGEGPTHSVGDTAHSQPSADKLIDWAINQCIPACRNLLDNCQTSADVKIIQSELKSIGTVVMGALKDEEAAAPILLQRSKASLSQLATSSSETSMFGDATLKALTNALSLIESLLERLETIDCVTPEVLKDIVATVQKIAWKVEACGFFKSESQPLKVHDAIFDSRFQSSSLGDMLVRASPPDIPKLQVIVEHGLSETISILLRPKLPQVKNEPAKLEAKHLPQKHNSVIKMKTRETVCLSECDVARLGLQNISLSTSFRRGEITGDVNSSEHSATPHVASGKTTVAMHEEETHSVHQTPQISAPPILKSDSETESQGDSSHSSDNEPEVVKSDSTTTSSITSSSSGDSSLQRRLKVKRFRHTLPQRLESRFVQPVLKRISSPVFRKGRISGDDFIPGQQTQLSHSLPLEGAPTNWSGQVGMQSATSKEEELILISVSLDRRSTGKVKTNHWFRIEVSTNMDKVFGQRQYIILRSSDNVIDLYNNMIKSTTPAEFPSSLKLPSPGSSKIEWRKMIENFLQYVTLCAELRQSSHFRDFLKCDVAFASQTESQFTTFEHCVTLFTDTHGTVKTVCDQKAQYSLSLNTSATEEDSILQSLSPPKRGSLIPLVEKDSQTGTMKFFSVEENGKSTLIISQEGDEYSLLAGTLENLVEQLIWTYPEYVSSFILGYRHFTSPMEMLNHLTKHFDVSLSAISTAEEVAFVEKWGIIMQLRVLDILAYWMTKCWPDFHQNQQMLDHMNFFIANLKDKNDSNFQLAAQNFDHIIMQQQHSTRSHGSELPSAASAPASTGLTISFPITEHTAKKLARELTLYDLQLLQAVTTYDLATYFWSSSTPERYSNLSRYTEHFKQLRYWTAAGVCGGPTEKTCHSLIEAFVGVAEHCLAKECNNLNTAMAVTCSRKHESLTVLKEKKQINPKLKKPFSRLVGILSCSNNYRNYRRHLYSIRKTTTNIPAFHVLITNLKSLESPRVLKNVLLFFSNVKHRNMQFEELVKTQQSSFHFPSRAQCENLYSSSYYKQFLKSFQLHKRNEGDQCMQPLRKANISPENKEAVVHHKVSIPDNQQQDFENNMVEHIVNRLTSEDVLLLASVENIPSSLMIAPLLALIDHLYVKGLFSLSDVTDISKLLNEVGMILSDLVESTVKHYHSGYKTMPKASAVETPCQSLIPPQSLPTTSSDQQLVLSLPVPSPPVGNDLPTVDSPTVDSPETLVPCLQNYDSVQFSCPPCAYDSEIVSFIDPPEVVIFNCKGGIYRNPLHGIKLIVPEGAVLDGKSIHIQVGLALYGPFIWPKSENIVSPIVGICMVQPGNEVLELQKPVEIHIPHFINCSEVKDCKKLSFLKANHRSDIVTINGKPKYSLKPFHIQQRDDEQIHFEPGLSFGILHTKHFCYLCIAAKYTREDTEKANFCLMGALPDPPCKPFDLYFSVSYMLDTCIKTMQSLFEIKFKGVQFKTLYPWTFNFTGSRQESRLAIHLEKDEAEQFGWIIGLQSPDNIKASEIDFWRMELHELLARESIGMYPPCFVLRISGESAVRSSRLNVSFSGGNRDLYVQIPLETGVGRLPSFSDDAYSSPVPSTLALPPQLMTTPAVSTGEGSVQSMSTTVEKQFTREQSCNDPVTRPARNVPMGHGLHVGQTAPSPPHIEPELHRVDASTEFSILPEIVGETQLIIETVKQSYFEWKGYGLKLYIPENALPQDINKCALTIRALLPGQIELLPGHILTSAVYQISVSVKLTRQVDLHIQHCASFENSDSTSLCFVVARKKSKHSHRFQKLEGGTFSSQSSYGSISLNHFCSIGIVRWLGTLFLSRPLLQYCAQLYRICQQNPADWGLHFVITKDLDCQITAIREKLEQKYSEVKVDDQFPVQFEDDVITLSIPREGVEIKGWKISCRHDPSITKAEVDSFRYSSGSALGCLFHIHLNQQPPAYFEYEVILKGAKPSRNFFTIIYPPLQAAGEDRLSASAHSSPVPPTLALPPQLMTTPAVSTGEGSMQSMSTTVETTSNQADATVKDLTTGIAIKLTTEPMLPDFMDLVAAEIPSKWKMMGIQLYLTDSQLDCIEVTSGDPLHCFSSVFTLWKRKETRLPLSWGTVLQALEAPSVGERKLARKISCQRTGKCI